MRLWIKQLVGYARLEPATLRSSPFGVNAMLRPPPKLYLFSCGWSDAPNHIEKISGGLVFDIGKVARDYDSYVRRWLFFGGEGGIIDKQLSRSKALNDLLDLLQSFCARF